MSFAFLPWYTGDYFRDTKHLTPEEHGIYLLLLAHCWDQRGPVPLDERRQCGIVNARSGGEIESLRRVLLEFFTRMDDGWYNHRMNREIERAQAISVKREDAGRRGANERMKRFRDAQAIAKQVLTKSQASDATPTPTPTLTPTTINVNTLLSSSPSAPLDESVENEPDDQAKATKNARLKTDAVELLNFLNAQTGRFFRPTATTLKPIMARLKEGYDVSDCRAVIVRKVRAWRGNDRMLPYLRPVTLFGAEKFAQYIGEVPTEEDVRNGQLPRLPEAG